MPLIKSFKYLVILRGKAIIFSKKFWKKKNSRKCPFLSFSNPLCRRKTQIKTFIFFIDFFIFLNLFYLLISARWQRPKEATTKPLDRKTKPINDFSTIFLTIFFTEIFFDPTNWKTNWSDFRLCTFVKVRKDQTLFCKIF